MCSIEQFGIPSDNTGINFKEADNGHKFQD